MAIFQLITYFNWRFSTFELQFFAFENSHDKMTKNKNTKLYVFRDCPFSEVILLSLLSY